MAETIEHCATCAEKTPHGFPGANGRALVGLAIFVAGVLCLFDRWPLPLVCVPLAIVALASWWIGRERFGHIECQRCRYKQVKLRRNRNSRRRIKLGPNTIIDPW